MYIPKGSFGFLRDPYSSLAFLRFLRTPLGSLGLLGVLYGLLGFNWVPNFPYGDVKDLKGF